MKQLIKQEIKKVVLTSRKLGYMLFMGVLGGVLSVVTACSESQVLKVSVTNTTPLHRSEEMVEIAASLVFEQLGLCDTDQFVIYDKEGAEIPYQLTYDEKVIFPVVLDSMETTTYTFQLGEPQMVNTQVFGSQYSAWHDDLTWENDKMAYRIFGRNEDKQQPALYGYDVFTKKISDLVMESRYGQVENEDAWKNIEELRKRGQKVLADSVERSISLEVDHGTGLDCYRVGGTLGAGTAALMNGESLIYPSCYQDFEILDNGPLRFTMRLKYAPIVVKSDSTVIETRVIQLDKGSCLNKTTVNYDCLTDRRTVAVGQVIHEPYANRYDFNIQKGYMAYADPTTDSQQNGIVYVGAVFPKNVMDMKVQRFPKVSDGALGHVLALNEYLPGDDFVYYWGAGWSKAGFATDSAWINYLQNFAEKIRTPLLVAINLP